MISQKKDKKKPEEDAGMFDDMADEVTSSKGGLTMEQVMSFWLSFGNTKRMTHTSRLTLLYRKWEIAITI